MLTWYYQDSLTTCNAQWFKQVLMKLILSLAWGHYSISMQNHKHKYHPSNSNDVEQTCHPTLHHPVDSTKQERWQAIHEKKSPPCDCHTVVNKSIRLLETLWLQHVLTNYGYTKGPFSLIVESNLLLSLWNLSWKLGHFLCQCDSKLQPIATNQGQLYFPMLQASYFEYSHWIMIIFSLLWLALWLLWFRFHHSHWKVHCNNM